LFTEYFDQIPESEQRLYDNLSLLARPGELNGLQDMTGQEQKRTFDAFWQRRDPTLTSGGRSRRAEHYRRVWYARTYFAEKMNPWDRRGEIYIRYGEPQYRSRSDRVNALPGAAAAAVKERIASRVYDSGTSVSLRTGVPDFPGWQWVIENPPGSGMLRFKRPPDIEAETYIEPSYPVDRGSDGSLRVPWESWVYTGVSNGVEFTFVDIAGSGRWNFPPSPPVYDYSRLVEIATTNSPGFVLEQIARRTPDHFILPPGVKPLEFYYDLASFRGPDEFVRQTPDEILAVYFGIPPEQLVREDPNEQVVVSRTVALTTPEGDIVSRVHDRLGFRNLQSIAGQRGAFIPELAAARVPPGDYLLSVQLTDSGTGKWGVYQQEVTVPSYRRSLALSDIELAWAITTEGPADKYRKGDVRVIPMASRSYRPGQSIHLYYEIYNLEKDAFGRTSYTVSYTIKRDVRRSGTLFGGVARLFDSLFTNRKPQFSVDYERSGGLIHEPVYIELDAGELKPGFNQVEVRILDRVSKSEVSRSAVFRLDSEETAVEEIKSAEQEAKEHGVPVFGRRQR